jgi:membrane protein
MNAAALKPHGIVALLKESYTEWSKDKCMRLAAALAYYSLFSIAPLILITIGVVGAIYQDEAAQGRVSQQLSQVMGWEVAKSVETMVASAGQNSKGATLTGIVMLLVGASSVFGQLKEALNTIWEVKPKPGLGIMGFIRTRLLSFGIVLVIGFLMLISLLLTALVSAFSGWIQQNLGIPPFIAGALGIVVPFAVEVVLFASLFKLLPDAQVRWKNVWVGAAVTALLFEIGKSLLGWYLGRPSTASAFGAASAPVLVMLWVYYNSLILFFGAEFTEVYSRAKGQVIQPKANALKVQPCEREEEGLDPEVVPHPSAAAAMAGRDPNTGSGPGEARRGYGGEAESSPSLLHPDKNTPSRPRKETLTPLRMEYGLYDPEIGDVTIEDVPNRTLLERAHRHPLTEIGAALGVGLLLGAISRVTENRRELGATQHFKLGGKAAGIAAVALAAKLAEELRARLRPEEVRKTAERATIRVRKLGKDIPKVAESIIR